MHFGELSRPMAGVAVPLFSLRGARSVGIGQFPDIVALAEWCRSVGLEVIQLLPLNDTGDTSSPYSALTAFGLNPVYLDVLAVPGSGAVRREVDELRAELESSPRVDYARVRKAKLRWLRRLFELAPKAERSRAALGEWMRSNPWGEAYAVFLSLKEDAGDAPWWEWKDHRSCDGAEIGRLFRAGDDRTLFHVWVQREAERQLVEAAGAAARLGVRLKGDLPILMSKDSADVWASPDYFDLSFQAGAPPDMFSPDGQNWGFPPYRWDALERDDYRFWRERVRHAGRMYHAIRIDHVLGFLRIWRIPSTESSGVLGHFHPSELLSRHSLGSWLDEGRLAWLSIPHTPGKDIDAALGADAGRVKAACFRALPGENLYRFSPGVRGEHDIEGHEPPGPVREYLLRRHRDRALIDVGDGQFAPAWYYNASSAYRSLTQPERERLDAAVNAAYSRSELLWETSGRKLLGMLRESADMLLCAEDLGAVPDCLPSVLSDLGILSLKIERWARNYKAAGHPLESPELYPRLSVCSPSVHDTTSLRGWWEEAGWDREGYYRLIGGSGPCPATLSTELCRAVLLRAMRSRSILAITQIQDYLALTEELRGPDPAAERVNVPGTQGPHNWSYRIPCPLEELQRRSDLADAVRKLVGARGGATAAAPAAGRGP